jgi:hypothetical protein
MPSHHIIIGAMALLKGLVMAIFLVYVIGTSYAETLSISILSATVSGAFLIANTYLLTRRTERKIDDRIDDLKSDVHDGLAVAQTDREEHRDNIAP